MSYGQDTRNAPDNFVSWNVRVRTSDGGTVENTLVVSQLGPTDDCSRLTVGSGRLVANDQTMYKIWWWKWTETYCKLVRIWTRPPFTNVAFFGKPSWNGEDSSMVLPFILAKVRLLFMMLITGFNWVCLGVYRHDYRYGHMSPLRRGTARWRRRTKLRCLFG